MLFQYMKEVLSIKELVELLVVPNNCMIPSVPEVSITLKLFFTKPVT